MDMKINHQINSLAYHLWASAGREYGRALEFSMMAEQMVWELVVGSARLSGAVVEAGAAIERNAPVLAAHYVQRTRELAYFMWEAAGAQYGRAMDYWIAAERHVMTMMMASGARPESSDAGSSAEPMGDQFASDAYLNAIRTDAYFMWENAGRKQDGDSLVFWLAAERHAMKRMEMAAMAKYHVSEPPLRNGQLCPMQRSTGAPETEATSSAPEESSTATPMSGQEPSPLLRIRRREPTQDTHPLVL